MASLLRVHLPTDVFTIFTCFILLLCTYVVAHAGSSHMRRRRLAPGPPRLPLIGNILQIPAKFSFIKFTEWSNKYGPIYSFSVLGQEVVVLNNHKTAADLLDRRSHIYSDRPRLILAGEILGGGVWLGFTRNGDIWRRMRRAMREGFNLRAVPKYEGKQTQSAIRAILRVLDDPSHWQTYIQTSTLSAILSSVYGYSLDECEDPRLVQRLHNHIKVISSAAIPGGSLVDLLPVLNHLPSWSMGWKRQALNWHQSETAFFEGMLDDASARSNDSNKPLCFAVDLLQKQDRLNLSRKETAWLAGIIFAAGAETTGVVLLNFILAMALHPGVMRKAQAELDANVGQERAPTLDDKENLPYIRAIIREVMRWRPGGPLDIPHMAMEDDVYEGYFIPKGTIVLANVWAMSRDSTVYPDFDEFRPERFLDETGTVDVVPPDTHQMGHTSFGYGRRICAGMDFANQGLFITVASILWTLDIQAPRDMRGLTLKPSSNEWVECGLSLSPAPIYCTFTPRFPDARKILETNQ